MAETEIAATSRKRRGDKDERLAETGWLTGCCAAPRRGAASGLDRDHRDLRAAAGRSALYSLEGSMTFLTLSAELGIIATAAALLIIGGEFDLSVGSMIGFAGVVIGLAVTWLHWPLWAAIAARLRDGRRSSATSTACWWCAPGCRPSSSRSPPCSSCAGSRSR